MAGNRITWAFGVALRECRRNLGLTQEQLALDASVDRSYVSELENGLKEPGVIVIFKISAALKMTPGAIVDKAYWRVDPPVAEVRENPSPPKPMTFSLGEETCPQCNAIYSVHARVLAFKEEGSFCCVKCGYGISSWFSTRGMVYSLVQSPPTLAGSSA